MGEVLICKPLKSRAVEDFRVEAARVRGSLSEKKKKKKKKNMRERVDSFFFSFCIVNRILKDFVISCDSAT